ncbi:TolC family protein [Vibrio owensii]|uniref:TolC family protein n=1 Tax=Vibrio owensii TaxID=696485 RepID=UPI0005F0C174|nr:TolC family protein [Vibrio owensii]
MNYIKSSLFLFLFSSLVQASTNLDLDLDLNIEEPVYTKDINILFKDSIENSYKVLSNKYAIESKSHLFDSAKYYYIPNVSITSQVKEKMDRPGHPSPFTEFTLDLSAKMKLWSNTTSDQKDAAYFYLKSAKDQYNESVSEIFRTVNLNLLKIELSRQFLSRAKEYRKRMDILLDKMDISTNSGLLKKSDKIFAEVTVKKFDESVLNVLSQIEQYRSQIDNITSKRLYDDEYGLSSSYIDSVMSVNNEYFDIDTIMKNNFLVLSKKANLMAEKKTAESSNEYFSIELQTVHDIKEHEKSSTKNDENQAVYGYTYDDNGDSYVGVQFSFNGLNYANYKTQLSEYELYKQKMIEFDEFVHGINIEIIALKEQYRLINERITNVNNQVNLTTDVIENQMNEMKVDESTVLDIFRNVSSLSDLEMSYLIAQNELVDTVNRIYALNSVLPANYVIN